MKYERSPTRYYCDAYLVYPLLILVLYRDLLRYGLLQVSLPVPTQGLAPAVTAVATSITNWWRVSDTALFGKSDHCCLFA